MAKWVSNQYATAAALEEAVEAIDNTVTIHVISFKEQGKTKFILIQAT